MRKLAILCSVVSLASLQAQETTAPVSAETAPVVPPAIIPAPVGVPVSAAPAEMALPAVNPNARKTHDFQGEEVGTVLRLLARQAGINIMVSDQITGTINMRVENLTPLEAIRIVVDAKGLDMSQTNNVYFIKTAAEKAKEPTESGSYTFSYAAVSATKGGDPKGEMAENERLKALIASQIQSGVAPQFDVRTNTVFYRDYKSNLANLALFLDSIDRPTQQVMIEARLVEVSANPKQSYGINWAGTLGGSQAAQTVAFGGSGLNSYKIVNAQTSTTNPTTGAVTTSPMYDANGFPVSTVGVDTLGAISTTGVSNFVTAGGKGLDRLVSGQFAILNIPQMSATLRLLNEDSDAEFLANPRVVTANNLKAQIKITTKQPVPKLKFNEQTASTSFDSFEDKEYGNTLEVTPTINKDSFVTMLVKPEISNKQGDANFTIGGTVVSSPIIDTRSLESNVLIKSGDTLAIGGLLQDQTLKSRTKVPVLGDIPVLGYLFQEHVNARTKRNLLVFITPTIIRQGYGTGLENQVSGLKNSGEEFADPNGWRNNARGAVRIVPTSSRQNVADYPKPGTAPAPVKAVAPKFKVTVPDREQ